MRVKAKVLQYANPLFVNAGFGRERRSWWPKPTMRFTEARQTIKILGNQRPVNAAGASEHIECNWGVRLALVDAAEKQRQEVQRIVETLSDVLSITWSLRHRVLTRLLRTMARLCRECIRMG
ncbi:MAG TPA: hypothetical protein DDZ51_01860 [Planctomycetaceae bacterium]|nr:hypothetical protein [Planctomycetaceae bacterium]